MPSLNEALTSEDGGLPSLHYCTKGGDGLGTRLVLSDRGGGEREGELGEGEKEERDILCMGTVHDDEAIHQFRVPLDHTPVKRETVH